MPKQKDTPTFADKVLDKQFTRRQVIIGSAVAGGALLAAGGTYYVIEGSQDDSGGNYISVSDSQVIGIEDCEEISELDGFMREQREIILPYASLAWTGEDSVISVLEPTEEGSPLVTAHTIDVNTGNGTEVLSAAITDGMLFEIFDFRANEKGYVWIESNILAGKTYVYTSTASAGAQAGRVAMEITDQWEIPQIAACGNYAWIQCVPTDANEETQRSRLYKVRFGDGESDLIQVDETRSFACAPVATPNGLVISPRNSQISSCYDIRLIDPANSETLDVCTLPQSMRPQDVGYGKTGFAFTFSGAYDYGDGISKMGSYMTISAGSKLAGDNGASHDARIENLSQQNWINFNRTPYTAPCWLDDMLVFKSTRAIAVFRPLEQEYALLSADDGADDYGIWLCSAGDTSTLVTLQNIDYTPLEGDAVKECRLRFYIPS